ncbi:MAG TPA: hypothetical protein ENJ15_00800 [Caldithrix abyssi]|uniref:Copper chaperone NosL n=1 Tax=Caldithrix abyssi TaxID=187145 RepID=A0A7V5RMY6_CALAY|nr:hypothetical protein [Caldithrix abyssi]
MKKSKILMITGSLLLLTLFALPLWNITLEAPQYPDPLGLDIHIDKLADGNNPNDVRNIDLLNHYIGMDRLPEDMLEFKIFPIVVLVMAILGVLAGLSGKPRLYLTWVIIMAILGVAGIYDFYSWLYHYGHNLNPHAILKFVDKNGNPMAYDPPVFGTKQLLNFTVHSYPASGAYTMMVGIVMAIWAFVTGKKEG